MHRPASFHVFTWLVNIVRGKGGIVEEKTVNQARCFISFCHNCSPYELVAEDVSSSNNLYRSVSEENKTTLKEALKERQIDLSNYNAIVALGSTSYHGFSEQVISDVAENCHKIFSLENVLTYSPIF